MQAQRPTRHVNVFERIGGLVSLFFEKFGSVPVMKIRWFQCLDARSVRDGGSASRRSHDSLGRPEGAPDDGR